MHRIDIQDAHDPKRPEARDVFTNGEHYEQYETPDEAIASARNLARGAPGNVTIRDWSRPNGDERFTRIDP